MGIIAHKSLYFRCFQDIKWAFCSLRFVGILLHVSRIVVISLFLMTTPVAGFGQNMDSLYTAFRNAKGTDLIRLGKLISASAEVMKQYDETPQNLIISDEIPQNLIIARVTRILIFEHFEQQRFRDVEKYIGYAIPIYEELEDLEELAGCYHLSGIANQYMGLFDKAIASYYKSSEILQSIDGDSSNKRSRYVLNNIADIYLHIKNYEMAEKLFNQCIEMINDMESEKDNMLDLSNYLSNLADIYCIQSENLEGNAGKTKANEAITSAKKALELAQKFEDEPSKLAKRFITLSNAYKSNSEYVEAEKLLSEAQTIAEKNNLKLHQTEILSLSAELKNITGNYLQAKILYEKAIEVAEQNEYNQLLEKITWSAYLLNKDADPASALKYYEKYVALKELSINEESQRQLNDFQVKHETAEKELEIERQQAEINRHRVRQNIFIGGLLIAALIVVMLVYIVRIRNRRNRELAETNATKDKFFSIISHDLKNPAIAQRDALQTLLDNCDRWDTALLTNYCQKLVKSSDSQVDMLYTLLSWAQLQTGRIVFQPSPFNLAELIRKNLDVIQNLADNKGVALVVRSPPKSLVTADYNMLNTIVRNLLINALKFTPKGGTVTMDISSVSSKYTVSIADNGIGMNAQQLKNLFRIDHQHSRQGTSGEQGSGLGLTVCRELLQKHGCELYVESEEGKGSRFWFELKG